MFITNEAGVKQGSELFLNIASPVAKEFYYYVHEVGHYFLSESYRFVSNNNENKIFAALLVKGEMKLHNGSESKLMQPGDILFTVLSNDMERRMLLHQVTSSAEIYWFFAGGSNSYEYSKNLLKNYANFGNAIVLKPDNLNIPFSFQEIFRLCKQDEYCLEQKMSKQLYGLIIDIGQSVALTTRQTLPMIDKALHYIENNYCSKIQLDDISDYVNLDKYYFSKLFKEHLGTSPYQYLIKKRIQYAKYILCSTDCSISEISEQVGYTDPTLFIRAFTKHTGLSPNSYRKQQS